MGFFLGFFGIFWDFFLYLPEETSEQRVGGLEGAEAEHCGAGGCVKIWVGVYAGGGGGRRQWLCG